MIRSAFIQRGLSIRESEVAELVANGLSNKQVADRLFVTEKTIKFHLTNIYRKMNIASRTQLILWSLPHLQFIPASNMAGGATQNAPSSIAAEGGQGQSSSITGATDAHQNGNPNERANSKSQLEFEDQGGLPIGRADSEMNEIKVS